jgi:hypothetical protein
MAGFGTQNRSTAGHLAGSAATAAVVLLATAVSLAAETAAELQKLAEQAIRRLDLQTELPVTPEPFNFKITFPPEALWVVIVVGLAVLLYAFRDMLPGLRFGNRGGWGEDEDALPGEVKRMEPSVVLGTADELAGQGRFVEAMHVLLLRGLAEIRQRLDEQFADSLTSREILRNARLSEQGRNSLHDIVTRVEWTYFGEHPAALEDYQACRDSFNALATALQQDAIA